MVILILFDLFLGVQLFIQPNLEQILFSGSNNLASFTATTRGDAIDSVWHLLAFEE